MFEVRKLQQSKHRLYHQPLALMIVKRTDHTNKTDQELVQRRRPLADHKRHGFDVILEEDSRNTVAVLERSPVLRHGVLRCRKLASAGVNVGCWHDAEEIGE